MPESDRRPTNPLRRASVLVRRMKPLGRWIAGVAAATVAAVLTTWLLAWGLTPDDRAEPATPGPAASGLPFTVKVLSARGGGWVSDKPMTEIPARPPWGEDWDPWADQVGAVVAPTQVVYFTVQGRSEAQVTLTDLKVRVVARRPAIRGTLFAPVEGGDTPYRWVSVDLDSDPPKTSTHVDEYGAASEHERRPIRFPYRVSLSDAESFEVDGVTTRCDCSWVIELSWVSQDRAGTYTVDDGGKPFRVTGRTNVLRTCSTLPDSEVCRNGQ
jgi:hypothetical protein